MMGKWNIEGVGCRAIDAEGIVFVHRDGTLGKRVLVKLGKCGANPAAKVICCRIVQLEAKMTILAPQRRCHLPYNLDGCARNLRDLTGEIRLHHVRR